MNSMLHSINEPNMLENSGVSTVRDYPEVNHPGCFNAKMLCQITITIRWVEHGIDIELPLILISLPLDFVEIVHWFTFRTHPEMLPKRGWKKR